MKFRLFFVWVLVVFSLSACGLLNSGGAGQPLFQDDFSNPDSGWDRMTGIDGETDYVDGAYRIFVDEPNKDFYANPGLSLSAVSVEVDATVAGGPEENDFGVMCRYEDNNNFYYFIISSDQLYGIGKIVNGARVQLAPVDEPPASQAILPGQTNRIRADCVGDTLALYVNGQKLVEVRDRDLTMGDIGLIAGSYSQPGTDVRFDNLVVTSP